MDIILKVLEVISWIYIVLALFGTCKLYSEKYIKPPISSVLVWISFQLAVPVVYLTVYYMG